jgi:hypothetical protein
MENGSNFYRILQVQPDASVEVIEASYRTLMQRLRMHPDLGGDHQDAALINEAFATLRDPVRRAAYDRMIAARLDGRPVAVRAALPAPPAPVSTVPASPVPAPPAPAEAAAPVIQACMNCAFCGTRHSLRAAQQPDARCASCRSPLHAVTLLTASGRPNARRAVERVYRRMPVYFAVASPPLGPLAGTSEDLSIYGMRLIAPVRLRMGSCVSIACEFCDAVGEVTHVQPASDAYTGAWRVGIQFLTFAVRQTRGSLVSLKA